MGIISCSTKLYFLFTFQMKSVEKGNEKIFSKIMFTFDTLFTVSKTELHVPKDN